MNGAYAARFGDHRPARSTVQVGALPGNGRVEIEAIAKPRRLTAPGASPSARRGQLPESRDAPSHVGASLTSACVRRRIDEGPAAPPRIPRSFRRARASFAIPKTRGSRSAIRMFVGNAEGSSDTPRSPASSRASAGRAGRVLHEAASLRVEGDERRRGEDAGLAHPSSEELSERAAPPRRTPSSS